MTLPTFPAEARCRTCKHWGDADEQGGDCRMAVVTVGQRVSWLTNDPFPMVQIDVSGTPPNLYLVTRADFGCVLWRRR